jgi:hypothetical protein
MKSIANQYKDLKEGRMSQYNFMRNLRMSMPQYITNVTSFKDAVRILKNKAILNEAMGGNPIKDTIKSYLTKGYSYAEAIELTAAEQGMDEEVLMSQYPQDAVDTEGYEDELYERYDGPSEPMGDEAYGDYYEMVGEELETIARTKYNLDEAEIEQMFENEWHSGKNDRAIEKAFKDGIEPSAMAERLIDRYINMDDDMFDDMIKRSEDELGPDKYKFDDYEGGLSEGRKKKEPKQPLHPNQIHPSELRMGIKIELEHTDDLNKAKKIALDHLAENPYYYTALKLSGIESPSAPKIKPLVAAKKVKKKDATEMVDTANQMQKVKMPKKVVNEVRINAMPGEETNATIKHAMQYIDSDIANPTLKALSDRLELQPLRDNRAILRYGYWEKMPAKALDAVKLQFNVEEDIDSDEETAPQYIYIISSKKKSGNLGSSLETGANKASQIDAFKEALEKLVRKTLAETFDGRDDLANITDYTK